MVRQKRLIWKNRNCFQNSCFKRCFLYVYKRVHWSGRTYIVILVFVAVIIADHWLGLPSALPLLAFILAARLLTQLDLNSHRLGWWCTREEEEGVTPFYCCWIAFLQQKIDSFLSLPTFLFVGRINSWRSNENKQPHVRWFHHDERIFGTQKSSDIILYIPLWSGLPYFHGKHSFHLKEWSLSLRVWHRWPLNFTFQSWNLHSTVLSDFFLCVATNPWKSQPPGMSNFTDNSIIHHCSLSIIIV